MQAERLYTLNGQLRPVARIQPGEKRSGWRVLNAFRTANYGCASRPHLHWIGADGIPFDRTRPYRPSCWPRAHRAEFVVRGGKPGRYRIEAAPRTTRRAACADRPALRAATLEVTRPQKTSGAASRTARRPPPMPDLPSPVTARTVSRDNSATTAPVPRSPSTAGSRNDYRIDVEKRGARHGRRECVHHGRDGGDNATSTRCTITSTRSDRRHKASRAATRPGDTDPGISGGTNHLPPRTANSPCAPTSAPTPTERPSATATSLTRTTARGQLLIRPPVRGRLPRGTRTVRTGGKARESAIAPGSSDGWSSERRM
ncbi:hypothetical protein GCM10020221_22660 [Streptomyces thioluteus]|uniref:Uncharacterized protein n=1 Tax=Streptomyces thioluteus TaxID=66431 RepID=A0ABP6JCK9_STRTU